jgi:uncharacterized protein
MVIKKEELINILKTWNYWENIPENFKPRKEYENKISILKNAKEVIVLKGIRRSGKSSLLNLEIKNLLEKVNKENILFINFEDPRFMNYLNVEFLDHIYSTYIEFFEPKGKKYIFLDEIQNISGWEKWVLRMYEKENTQIYVTGSSSKLLSSEFSTALSGRHLSIEVYPLSFAEFLGFKGININSKKDLALKKTEIIKEFNKYFIEGGFPKLVEIKNKLSKKSELISYYETIILKDIAKRYEISHISDLKKLSFYLLSNITKFYSINNLNKIGLGAYDTIKKYIEYLKEVYLLFDLELYDASVKKQLVNPKKIYAIDLGLINAVSFKFSDDKGRILENMIFIELKRKGKEVYYFKDKNECDFIIKEGLNIVEAIQVTLSLDESNKKREINGLVEVMDKFNLKKGLILTLDDEYEEVIKQKDKKFRIIVKPAYKWLLEL